MSNPTRYYYGWINNHGWQNMLGEDMSRALDDAEHMDQVFPADGPHRPIRYRLDDDWEPPARPAPAPLPTAPLQRYPEER